MSKLCIGLFGTCGGSKWRDPFKEIYDIQGINYFDPQVPDWKPEYAEIEADHLANDDVILFPVTGETYGLGSLSEIGFSILNAIRLDDRRDFVVLIDPVPSDALQAADPLLFKESAKSRALVRQHLMKLRLPNVYWISALDTMLKVSIDLYEAAVIKDRLKSHSLTK